MKRLQPLWWTLAALAFALLLVRGYKNSQSGFRGDDSQLYLGVRQLFQTGSFYRDLDYATIARPGETVWPEEHHVPNAYPPATALFYLPFALLPWPMAHVLWFLMNTACLVVLGIVLFREFGYRLPREALPIWLFALFVSFPPYDVAFMGQTSFPIVLTLTLGWRYAFRPGKAAVWLSALFYSIALTKLTVALAFLLYQLCHTGSRRAAVTALALTAVLTLAVMGISGKPLAMLTEYRSTINALFQVGALNDTSYGQGHSSRTRMTTASVLYFDLIRALNGHPNAPETPAERTLVRGLEWLVGLAGILFFLRYALALNKEEGGRRKGEAKPDSAFLPHPSSFLDDWAFAALNAFSMVVLYHNWYDLGQLFIPYIIVLNALVGEPADRRTARLLALANLVLLLYVIVRTQFVHLVEKLAHLSHDAAYADMTNLARILLTLLFFQLAAEMLAAQRAVSSPSLQPA
jgi:hypothetical protein